MARAKRASFADQPYWGRPVPSFGGPDASMLPVGLAPAAQDGNRTGRIFTRSQSLISFKRSRQEEQIAFQADVLEDAKEPDAGRRPPADREWREARDDYNNRTVQTRARLQERLEDLGSEQDGLLDSMLGSRTQAVPGARAEA